MQGLIMVEGNHEGDDEDSLFEHKHHKVRQPPSQNYGHQYSQDTNSMVLLNPKWPTTKTSCLIWII